MRDLSWPERFLGMGVTISIAAAYYFVVPPDWFGHRTIAVMAIGYWMASVYKGALGAR